MVHGHVSSCCLWDTIGDFEVFVSRVAVGVKHFKKGELDQAKKLLNHALDIDPSNVEGLVARGAL